MKVKKYFITALFIIGSTFQTSFANQDSTAKKPLYWIDTMEPTIHYDKPGKSRMGMETVPVYADESTNSKVPIVKIAPETVNSLSMRTATVTKGTIAERIDTVGYINPNEHTITHIHTYIDGWIKKLMVKASGEKVNKGQLLLQLYSPTLVNAEEEYLIALNTRNMDLVNASQKKLMALGISEQQIQRIKAKGKSDQLIDIYSPQNGIVSELNVREGMQVNPETTIMSLADLSNVWMMAEVYEGKASLVAVGEEVEARLSSMPNQVIKGKVDYVYPQVDTTTRTLKIRMQFANPNYVLKPGMYANISILAKPLQDVISIPLEALIRTGQGDRVIVALGEGRFEPRIVEAGMESGDHIVINSGLKPGEQVVTSAQFMIDSEANLKGTLDRLTPANQNANNVKDKTTTSINVAAIGVIKGVNSKEHKLKITHQPIKELNWPSMTMDFVISSDIDLSQIKVGDSVNFNLQTKGDDYLITSIKETSSTTQNSNKAKKDAAAIDPIARGIIKAIKPEEHMLKITHQPIKELGWPEMTMDFPVAPSVDISQLKTGDAVEFNLLVKGDDYTIVDIKKKAFK